VQSQPAFRVEIDERKLRSGHTWHVQSTGRNHPRPPTNAETKDMVIFKKTTYRYEDGKKFAMITFKNDEVDTKDTNLGREP
jgi:hypothetical protein